MHNASNRFQAAYGALSRLSLTLLVLASMGAGVFSAPPVQAQQAPAPSSTLGIDLNNDAARLNWSRSRSGSNTRWDASVLHHSDRGSVVSGGFHVTGNAATQQRPVNAGLGGRLYYASSDIRAIADVLPGVFAPLDESGSGVGLGGFFESRVPNYDRIGFGAHLYYVPDVLAFGDLKQLTDIWIYGSYSVLRQGDVYLGWRNVKGDFDGVGDFTFDTGVHLGFNLKF